MAIDELLVLGLILGIEGLILWFAVAQKRSNRASG